MPLPRFSPLLLALLATLTAHPIAYAQPVPADTSYTEPSGQRVIRITVDVPAEPEAVWARLTTADGWQAWAVPHAQVDFRVGGIIETTYGPTFTPGDPANIRNQILAYVPGEMLAFRAVQAPPAFPSPELFFQTATVMQLQRVPGGTRVTLTGTGFGTGPEWDRLYAMFRGGNAFSLANLRESFVKGPVDWAARRAAAAASLAK